MRPGHGRILLEKRGQVSQFERMLKHSNWLQPLARGLIGDEHLAEDVVQETWIAAWRRPPRDPQSSPAWLRQVLQSLVHMQFRSDGRRQARERVAARSEAQAEELPLELVELRHEIVRALLDLDEPFQSTLILRFYEDLSSAEIARRQGIPAATVRVRLKRGLDCLRDRLNSKRQNYLPALFTIAEGKFPCSTTPNVRAEQPPLATPGEHLRAVHYPVSAPRNRRATTAAVIFMGGSLVLISFFLHDPHAADESVAASRGVVSRESVGSAPSSGHRTTARRELSSAISSVDTAHSANSALSEEMPSSLRTTSSWRDPSIVEGSSGVELRVVDSLGRPVAHAQVSSGERRLELAGIAAGYASSFEFLLAEPCPQLLGRTAIDGTLRVPKALLRSAPLAVSASHLLTTREGPRHRQLIDDVYTVTLQPPLDTVITVEDEYGMGVAECIVTVTGRDAAVSYRTGSDSEVWHSSHDDVELVRVEAPGFAAVQDLLTSPRHTLRLTSGRSARGIVVDALGHPVAGATVSMRTPLWRGPAHTRTTDVDGAFETLGLSEGGTLDIRISHPGHPSRVSSHVLPCTELGELALAAPHRLEGRVLDVDGSPCAGAVILALPEGEFLSREVLQSRSDVDGDFVFPAVAAGSYVLRAEHHEFAATEAPVTTSTSQHTTLRFSFGESIWGRVQTPGGQGVAGVPVKIGTIVGDELRGPVVYSDADGRFRLDRLPSGEVQHRARRRVLRWRALDPGSIDRPTLELVAELFRPHQLISANDIAVPQLAHFGSRNTVAVRVGDELCLTIADPDPAPPIDFELSDSDGRRLRAFSNVLIVSPNDWIMKDFAGVDGRPFQLPNAWVLDGAQMTVMSRGYCWQTVHVDLRGDNGKIGFVLHPLFERPAILEINGEPSMPLLVAPLLPGVAPLAALPIGSPDAQGRLVLNDLGPGHYALCTPRSPESLFGKSGKRRLAMLMHELHIIGNFELSASEGQMIPIELAPLANTKEEVR